ncbi:MAG: mannose-1-phosphate guanylyltransferase [Prevotella sp.]|nr:mannose-1-phosphate guanylyltransferase [Prevotella sp.]
MNKDCYCVILAGGKGRRLWPCSRERQPKQFVDFFGTGRTQLQQTFDRFAKIMPVENIFVSTSHVYAHYVYDQLPELPSENVLSEPVHRNTAPSVAWAAYRISHLNPQAKVIVSPSDQAVFKEEAFENNVAECFDIVGTHDWLIALGVKPTRPEPGYGYIQLGDETGISDLYTVQSFTEKPEREFARMFMQSGEFYWNTGIFLSNVRYLVECLRKILPVVLRNIDNEGQHVSLAEEVAYIEENFSKFPNLSADYGILERSENVFVQKCDFGWADLGTWHSIYEALSRVDEDNVVIDSQVIMEDCKNNIVKLPAGHLGVINGLDGYIIAEKGNVLLICKKGDSSALVRKYVNEVQIQYGEDFI